MPTYSIFDLTLDSDLGLPELPPAASGQATLLLRRDPALSLDRLTGAQTRRWTDPRGHLCFESAADSAGWQLCWPGTAVFRISRDLSSISYHGAPGLSPTTQRHLLLDHVIPRLRGQRGALVLHASAVRLPDHRCLLFLGESGRGKSSLAAAMAGADCALLSDDAIMVQFTADGCIAVPAYRSLRLRDDTLTLAPASAFAHRSFDPASGKYRLGFESTQMTSAGDNPDQLDALYLLGPGGEAVRSPELLAPGAAGMVALAASAFCLDPGAKDIVATHFRLASRLADSVSCFAQLDYPRRLSALPAVVRTLMQSASNVASGKG